MRPRNGSGYDIVFTQDSEVVAKFDFYSALPTEFREFMHRHDINVHLPAGRHAVNTYASDLWHCGWGVSHTGRFKFAASVQHQSEPEAARFEFFRLQIASRSPRFAADEKEYNHQMRACGHYTVEPRIDRDWTLRQRSFKYVVE
jgi:hypothetical protein